MHVIPQTALAARGSHELGQEGVVAVGRPISGGGTCLPVLPREVGHDPLNEHAEIAVAHFSQV